MHDHKRLDNPLVRVFNEAMRLSDKQIERLVNIMFLNLKKEELVTFNTSEGEAFQKAVLIVKNNFNEEKQLDAEVNHMMDDLESKGAESFQRYKMFPMLKKRLAEQKGFVL